MKVYTVNSILHQFLIFIVSVLIVLIIGNNSAIFNKWHVDYLSPLGKPSGSPGLLYFINEQIRLDNDLLPVDSIFRPKKEDMQLIEIFVIDQTTPRLTKTQQYENFQDFNFQVERLCDSRFEFMKYSGSSRGTILQETFPFHEAIGFYLLANTMVQNKNLKYCVLDYFGGNTAPLSLRITSGDKCVSCTPFICEEICRELISGPKGRPIDALKRSNFADFLTNIKNYLLVNVKSDKNKNQPIEITIVSDFVHEPTTTIGKGPHISYDKVNRKFSELLNECPEIKSLNLIKLPMRIDDLDKAEETHNMLKSFVERFRNGDTSLDLIEIDNLGESSECIDWLNTYSAENLKQTKPIRVFAPFKNGSFNDFAKGYFSVAALGGEINVYQICIEPSCFERLNIAITKPNNGTFKVQIPQKSEFVKFSIPSSDTLSLTIKDVETINSNANPVLRIISSKGDLNESIKYESISFPVQFLPRMSRSDILWLGYLILIALVGLSYLILDFTFRRISDRFYFVLFLAIFLVIICYLILIFGLPDFPYRKRCLVFAFIIPFVKWLVSHISHSKIKDKNPNTSGQGGNPDEKVDANYQSNTPLSSKPAGKTDDLQQIKTPEDGNYLPPIESKNPVSTILIVKPIEPSLNKIPSAKINNPTESQKLYVKTYTGKTLTVDTIFETNVTFYVLEIDPKNSKIATVSLSTNLETRKSFLKGEINSTICQFEGRRPSKAKDIKQTKSGRARLVGEHWEIENPVVLKDKTLADP